MGESVKKGKFIKNIFFQTMFNEVKKVVKLIYADVKAHINQQDKKELFIRSTM